MPTYPTMQLPKVYFILADFVELFSVDFFCYFLFEAAVLNVFFVSPILHLNEPTSLCMCVFVCALQNLVQQNKYQTFTLKSPVI